MKRPADEGVLTKFARGLRRPKTPPRVPPLGDDPRRDWDFTRPLLSDDERAAREDAIERS